jgi:hypothetical protein
MDLKSIIIPTQYLKTSEIELLGRQKYRELYLTQGKFGIHSTHDQQPVFFWEDRFNHAFFTSSDRARYPDRKDILAVERIERMAWIGKVISGQVPNTGCWEGPSPTGRRKPPNRFYLSSDFLYIIWLEPRYEGGWKFSTAYSALPPVIRKYCGQARKIWAYK